MAITNTLMIVQMGFPVGVCCDLQPIWNITDKVRTGLGVKHTGLIPGVVPLNHTM